MALRRGPLLAAERLREIVRFNLGANDGLRDRYLEGPRDPGRRAAAPAAGPQNVILIGVGTLGADHLGAYGDVRLTSSNLDRFARESVVFERCITPSG